MPATQPRCTARRENRPADAVDPDVGHVGGGAAVDDLLAGIVDVGQAGPVAPQPDQVGPLARPRDPTSLSSLSAYAPLNGGFGQNVAGGQGRASSPVSFWTIAAALAASSMF
jgi:hypothetical protein